MWILDFSKMSFQIKSIRLKHLYCMQYIESSEASVYTIHRVYVYVWESIDVVPLCLMYTL